MTKYMERVSLWVILSSLVELVSPSNSGPQKKHHRGALPLVNAAQGHVVHAVKCKPAVQGRNGVGKQAATLLHGYKSLAIDEAAAGISADLRGRGQAGIGRVFLAGGGREQRGGQTQEQVGFHDVKGKGVGER